jgi:subtilisin family serine protease
MSVGGGAYQALDTAIANLVNSGVPAVIAAGNDNKDACNYSPARAPLAITVGATSKNDARASFSNWGTCVDIFGPGDQILSLGIISDSATATMSGTSMATPHVSGVVAQYLESNPSATPAQVASYLISIAASDKVTNPGSGSPNKLLQTVPARSSPAPTNSAAPQPTNSAAPQPTSSAAPPVPAPTPAPCTSCSKYSGNLRWTADFSVQPNGNHYRTTATSTHRAWLSVASDNINNVDFDLVLYKAVDGKWQEVSASRSVGNDERIVYTGDAGYYYFSVVSTKGSGPFDIYVQV